MKPGFISITLLFSLVMSTAYSQALITEIEESDISVILNNPTFVTLENGDQIEGKLSSASLANGYLKNVTMKLADGSKMKLQPEEMLSLKVKASRLAKLSMINESGSSLKELKNTKFDQIINREFIFFERAYRATKKDKPAMMQLLNPGFDSKIKVYADPNARETNGIGLNGIQFTGGEEKSFLFVKNNEKVVIVKKGSYRKNFEELYADCPVLIESFEDDKIRFKELSMHIFAYDQLCGSVYE